MGRCAVITQKSNFGVEQHCAMAVKSTHNLIDSLSIILVIIKLNLIYYLHIFIDHSSDNDETLDAVAWR